MSKDEIPKESLKEDNGPTRSVSVQIDELSWLRHDLRDELSSVQNVSALIKLANDDTLRQQAISVEAEIKHLQRLVEQASTDLLAELEPSLERIVNKSQVLITHESRDHTTQRRSRILKDALNRMEDLVAAAKQRPRPESTDLNALVREMQGAFQTKCEARGVGFRIFLAQDLYQVFCVKTEITAVLRNLCTNAIEAMPDGGELKIKTKNADTLPPTLVEGRCNPYTEPHVMLCLSDTGVGMSETLQRLVFQPHVSTKGEGRGLGLHLIDKLIRRNNGHIQFGSALGRGTRFELLFCGKKPS